MTSSTLHSSEPSETDKLHFLQRLARLLVEYNSRTGLLERRLHRTAQALGIDNLRIDIGYRCVTLYTIKGTSYHSRAHELRINIAVAAKAMQIADNICDHTMNLHEAIAALELVERNAVQHNRWQLALIFGTAASALAALSQGDAAAIFVVGLASALGLLARQEIARHSQILLALPFTAALIGSLLGGLFIRMGWTQTQSICLIVPALMLVPGPHLINGLYDTIENNIQTGLPRLWLALSILVAASLGILIGGRLTLDMNTIPAWYGGGTVPLWLDMLLAGIVSCGFGAFYNAPWRVLWMSILCGMIGHGIRYLCLQSGWSLEASTLVACLTIGFMANTVVHRLRVAFAAVSFASAVPMMPGTLIFSGFGGMMEIIVSGQNASQPLIAGTLANLFQACAVVAAMGIGLLVGARINGLVWSSLHKGKEQRLY